MVKDHVDGKQHLPRTSKGHIILGSHKLNCCKVSINMLFFISSIFAVPRPHFVITKGDISAFEEL